MRGGEWGGPPEGEPALVLCTRTWVASLQGLRTNYLALLKVLLLLLPLLMPLLHQTDVQRFNARHLGFRV